jgi:hypothetical protein
MKFEGSSLGHAMRIGSIVLASLVLCTSTAAAAQWFSPTSVDLNVPGALDALRTGNPEHFRKITRLIEEFGRRPAENLLAWVEVRFGVKNPQYGMPWLVSWPPQRRLSFALDDVRYSMLVPIHQPVTLIYTGNESQ